MEYTFIPKGVCSRKITFEINDGVVSNVRFAGGCAGNTLGLAALAEGMKAEEVVERSVRPLLDAGADTIVLGCTHYPFLSDTILKVAGNSVRIIDPAPAVARHLLEVMQEKGLIHEDGFSIELHSSGDRTTLEQTYKNLL